MIATHPNIFKFKILMGTREGEGGTYSIITKKLYKSGRVKGKQGKLLKG